MVLPSNLELNISHDCQRLTLIEISIGDLKLQMLFPRLELDRGIVLIFILSEDLPLDWGLIVFIDIINHVRCHRRTTCALDVTARIYQVALIFWANDSLPKKDIPLDQLGTISHIASFIIWVVVCRNEAYDNIVQIGHLRNCHQETILQSFKK